MERETGFEPATSTLAILMMQSSNRLKMYLNASFTDCNILTPKTKFDKYVSR